MPPSKPHVNPPSQEYGQDAQERACAAAFLELSNSREDPDYELRRAEEAFPELIGRLRWEFVAQQRDSPTWIGIEVKRLPILGLSRPWSDWKKLLEQVTAAMQGRFEGVVGVHLPPRLNLNQKRRKELVPLLADVIIEEASTLGLTHGMKDVGPQVGERFSHWPRTKSNRKEYERWGEYMPCSIRITRESDEGCGVRLFGVGNGGDLIEAHNVALANIFSSGNAGEQLKLAKAKGAKCTVLLLSCDAGYQEEYIREYVRGLPSNQLTGIDHIHVVGGGSVVEVFPGEVSLKFDSPDGEVQ